jgi:hypothetical protein
MKLNANMGAVLLLLVTSSCAQPGMRIATSGPGVLPAAHLAFLESDEDAPVVDMQTRQLIEAALIRQGYQLAADGEFVVDFSLAERSAEMGVSPGAPNAWLSSAKKKTMFQSCKDRIHRLTLLVTDRRTGQLVFRGGAEQSHCKGSLATSRTALVDAVVADLKKPMGDRQISVHGVN